MPRILATFDASRVWFRGVLRGISGYARRRSDWEVALADANLPLGWAMGAESPYGEIDGGIVSGEQVEPDTTEHRLPPLVVVGGQGDAAGVPRVLGDSEAAGRLAAEHLLDAGFRTLVAFTTGDPSDRIASGRLKGYLDRGGAAGVDVEVFVQGPRTRARGRWLLQDQLLDLGDFLKGLPSPLGVFAYNSTHAMRALTACERAGLRVPEEVAIVCGDDQEEVLEAVRPSITGVRYDNERVGHEAAEVLDRLMRGERVPLRTLVPPEGVVRRESSDFMAIEDKEVAAAVQHIWHHVGDAVTVQGVCEQLHFSRSTLIRKFREALGRTPSDEIRRARIDTAKRLLSTTDLPLGRVALDSGYGQQSQLNRYIKADTGLTPVEYRLHDRRGGG